MSGAAQKYLIEKYMSESLAPGFLTSLAVTKTFPTEEVEVDIESDDEEVAIMIQDHDDSGRMNEANRFTNKSFKPPEFKEVAPLKSSSIGYNRIAGEHPFTSPSFQAKASSAAMSVARKMEKKIRRAVELQGAQVLQSGTATFINAAGSTLRTINYQAPAAHFVNSSAAWGGGSEDKIADIEALAEKLHQNGKGTPNRLIFGDTAWTEFLLDTNIQSLLDNRRMTLGQISGGQVNANGGIFKGTATIGDYTFELWTYPGFYKHQQSGAITRFIDSDNVVMLCDNTRLGAYFGAIYRFAPPDARVLPYIPSRMSGPGMDMHPNAWLSPDAETLHVSVGARPMFLPIGLKTFGRLHTTP